ncbi:hypothetical protein RvY_17471 [Ramazzottius varieornatus]|uniref:Uncharacterized protein n=1 Tax=Ramazzottius varieornatus TaxID=947166 RepID=A0A1D1W332_RAMVA|nr:hypothetical protein RvY_17471 [Ramazzottius varieornatus]
MSALSLSTAHMQHVRHIGLSCKAPSPYNAHKFLIYSLLNDDCSQVLHNARSSARSIGTAEGPALASDQDSSAAL